MGPQGLFSGSGQCQDNLDCIGNKNLGPVIPGDFDMISSSKFGGSYWLRNRNLVKEKLCTKGISGRCEFFLHKGTRSLGCITADKNNPALMKDFDALMNRLSRERTNSMRVVR